MTVSFKKLFPWLIAVFGITVLGLICLIVIAPTLVNLEAVKREIETVTSRMVGGTVTADHIGLSILPRPRIVLTEPRISIPGSVDGGMHSLDVQIRLLPLLRRTIQVNSIELHQPRFTFLFKPGAQPDRQGRTKQGPGKGIAELLAVFTERTAGLTTTIDKGRFEVRERGRSVLLIRDLDVTAEVPVDQPQPHRSINTGEQVLQFLITGHIDRATVESPVLPGPAALGLETFTASTGTFSFENGSVKMLDGTATATGSLTPYLDGPRTLELKGQARAGARIVEWIRSRAGLPLDPVLRTPIEAKNIGLRIKPGPDVSLSANLNVSGGPSIAFAIAARPEQIALRKCEIRDKESQAWIGVRIGHQGVEASFQGTLTRSTLDRLFTGEQSVDRWIRGNVRARFDRGAPYLRSLDGTLEAANLQIPVKKGMPLEVLQASLIAEGNSVQIASARLRWADVTVDGAGVATLLPESIAFDLDARAGDIHIDAIKQSLAAARDAQAPARPADEGRLFSFPVQGEIRAAVDSVSLGKFTFRPLRSVITISHEAVTLSRTESSFCGIGLTGDLEFRRKQFSLDGNAKTENMSIEDTLGCLDTRDERITGTFGLSAHLSGAGRYRDFTRELNGPFDITARNGSIKRFLSIAKMLDLINSTEVFRGNYPGLGNEGLKYNSISLKGDVGQGNVTIHEGVMDGTTMEIVTEGSADLRNGSLDFRAAVAPLKTVDAVVKRLPLVKDILGGTLIAVPFRVTGTLKKPEVRSISLAEAGGDVTTIFSRTFKAPFKFVEGLVPAGKGKSQQESPQKQ